MVKQQVKQLAIKYDARIDYELMQNMFFRRLSDDTIKISKALEAEFDDPQNSDEKEIKKLISSYRKVKLKEIEIDLGKQEERLRVAEDAIKVKATKKAQNDLRISTEKIDKNLAKIAALKRSDLVPTDSRIFPMSFAPIIVRENDEKVIKLARYHCRPANKPASIDTKYSGLYNARSDNLGNAFWKDLFGHKHGFFVVNSFYENVSSVDYGPSPTKDHKNLVVQFTAKNKAELKIACLYDYWESNSDDGFYSFAALTGDPTREVLEAGHDRLIIALADQNLESWLNPAADLMSMKGILDNPERHQFLHAIVK